MYLTLQIQHCEEIERNITSPRERQDAWVRIQVIFYLLMSENNNRMLFFIIALQNYQ